MRKDFVGDAVASLNIEEPIARAFLSSAEVLGRRPEVARLAWHCHQLLFGAHRMSLRSKWVLPSLKEHAGMFPALVWLSGLPGMRAIYDQRGIPAKIAADTLGDLPMCMHVYRKENGSWGLGALNWMVLHVLGAICRLGRLQLMPEKFSGAVRVVRRKDGRDVKLLAQDGTVFRKDGYLDGANGVADERGRWTARYSEDGRALRGHPISRAGTASREEIELPAAEWEVCLSAGDPVLEIHIPAGEPLKVDACRDSFSQAHKFFPRHFPEVSFRAFVCRSWLLDPTYARILPPSSNIVGFQGLFHLYPAWGDGPGAFYRVFGNADQDLSSAPRDTKLRRAIADLYQSGERLIGGGGGVLPLASEGKPAIN